MSKCIGLYVNMFLKCLIYMGCSNTYSCSLTKPIASYIMAKFVLKVLVVYICILVSMD